jgi:hypothetical protein
MAAVTSADAANSSGPPTSWSTPITSHFDSVLECLDFLDAEEKDVRSDKLEVIEGVRSRLHKMVSKVLMNNSVTSMSMQGWKIE